MSWNPHPPKNDRGEHWLRRDPGWEAARWRHGWTTDQGPDFRSAPATAAHCEAMAVLGRAAGQPDLAWVHQVHGGDVLHASGPGLIGAADALWTDVPRLGVVGRGADCPLILVGGRRADGSALWGFAHASWRSTVARVTATLMLRLREAGLLETTARALICPSAGPCCYEVGAEVREAARRGLGDGSLSFFAPCADRWRLDLWAANAQQLTEAGVPPAAITLTGHCTICGGDLYPSHRRQGAAAGRFAAFIGGVQP
jgi:YfiH family protein